MTVAHRRRPARVLIVAAAGYGKSTALDAEQPPEGVRWRASEALRAELPTAPWLGVDDFDELPPREQRALARRLARLPGETGFAIATRTPLDPTAERELRGPLHERGPAELLLAPHEVARVLAEEYGLHEPEAAERVHHLTAGWPALVHLAAEALTRRPRADLEWELTRPGSSAAFWIGSAVVPGLPPETVHVLGRVAGVGPVTPRFFARVALALGIPTAKGVVEQLRRVGVLVARPVVGGADELVVVPAVARVLATREQHGADPASDTAAFRAAAAAYEAEGLAFPAARCHARAGDLRAVVRLVEGHGEEMLRQGHATGVAELLGPVPEPERSDLAQRTYADALRVSGEPAAALHAFRRLIDAAGGDRWPVELATRVAAVHYTLGDFGAALATLERAAGNDAAAEPDVEHVEWMTLKVRTLSMLGAGERAAGLAAETLRAAEWLGTSRALAAAHLAMARTTEGARKEAHHDQAGRAAEACGDAVTAALVLVNQCHLLLASARYEEAAETAREAMRIAELSCPPGRRVAALHNLAEALTRLGDFDEATWALQRSVALCRRLGPGRTALGLLGLAEIYRLRGHDERAHAAYAEAVGLARGSHERQVLVPALAGLARMDAATEPDLAHALAEEAERESTPALRPFAQIALGWVALAGDRSAAAADHAREAVEGARRVQAFDLLAEALELTAECSTDPGEARTALTEALTIWSGGGAVSATARVEVLLGGLEGADVAARSQGRVAARRLMRMGILQVNGRPVSEERSARRVSVSVLGGFAVTVDGSPVPHTAWRSRQARTLVKLLAARRGRPLHRAGVCEQLWPDDDQSRTGHRLSVLLATVRGVLDPQKQWPTEWYVASDLTGIWLDLRHVRVDADDLVRDADQAAELIDGGETERAREILTDVDERYRGDAFEDDPYEEWADGLREEARAAWLRSVRRLVTLHRREGRAGDAQGLLVRLLAADPYDEQAHRLLVQSLSRTGRHGEARRAFDRWTDAMAAIDAPRPAPVLLRPADQRVRSL